MQSDLIQLHPLLTRLKLTGILEILEETITQALNEKWNYSQLLLHLFSNEIDKRDHNQSCRRLLKSNLDPTKTLSLTTHLSKMQTKGRATLQKCKAIYSLIC